jgi:catechol 2,3-dioxygenase-like lactoylglutathione lyase family enzyme
LPCEEEQRQNPPREILGNRAGNIGLACRVTGTRRRLQTIHGKEYKDATISRVETDGIVITTIELPRESIENHRMKTRCLDHIDLRLKDMEVARKFYGKFLPQLGFV